MKNNIVLNRTLSNIEYVVHLPGDYKQSGPYLNYWIQKFRSNNRKFAVLVRDTAFYNSLVQEHSKVPAFYAASPLDVEAVFSKLPKMKAVVYLNNFQMNIHSLRFNEYQHIFIGNKNTDFYSKPSNVYKAYDSILVSGEFAKDKFKQAGLYDCGINFGEIGLSSELDRNASDVAMAVVSDHCTLRKNLFSTLQCLSNEKKYSAINIVYPGKNKANLETDLLEVKGILPTPIEINNKISSIYKPSVVVASLCNLTMDTFITGSPIVAVKSSALETRNLPYFIPELPYEVTLEDNVDYSAELTASLSRVQSEEWQSFFRGYFSANNFAHEFNKAIDL